MQTFHRGGDDGASVALVGLAIVIISLAMSFWWWTHGAWGDFSVPLLDQLAGLVTYGKPDRPLVGYEAELAGAPASSAEGAAVERASAAAASARFCAPGQAPAFVLGFAELKRHLGAAMGEPIECEHPNPDNGDTLQQTTTGLAIYRPSTNVPTFTDGWRHWALVDGALIAWEGQDSSPPVRATAVAH